MRDREAMLCHSTHIIQGLLSKLLDNYIAYFTSRKLQLDPISGIWSINCIIISDTVTARLLVSFC